jgi:hypothetical protein
MSKWMKLELHSAESTGEIIVRLIKSDYLHEEFLKFLAASPTFKGALITQPVGLQFGRITWPSEKLS